MMRWRVVAALTIVPLPSAAADFEALEAEARKNVIDVAPVSLPNDVPKPTRTVFTATPVGGVTFGRWIDLPITRALVGGDFTLGSTRSPIHGAGTAILEGGRTENGLGTYRLELGGGFSTKPWWLRFGMGIHLAYAVLVRATETNAFWKALGGDIGGVGVGLHANVEVAIPLSRSVALTLGSRGVLETYDGGSSALVSALLGLRF